MVISENPPDVTESRNKVLQQQEEAVSVRRLRTMSQPEDFIQKKTCNFKVRTILLLLLIIIFFFYKGGCGCSSVHKVAGL